MGVGDFNSEPLAYTTNIITHCIISPVLQRLLKILISILVCMCVHMMCGGVCCYRVSVEVKGAVLWGWFSPVRLPGLHGKSLKSLSHLPIREDFFFFLFPFLLFFLFLLLLLPGREFLCAALTALEFLCRSGWP